MKAQVKLKLSTKATIEIDLTIVGRGPILVKIKHKDKDESTTVFDNFINDGDCIVMEGDKK